MNRNRTTVLVIAILLITGGVTIATHITMVSVEELPEEETTNHPTELSEVFGDSEGINPPHLPP